MAVLRAENYVDLFWSITLGFLHPYVYLCLYVALYCMQIVVSIVFTIVMLNEKPDQITNIAAVFMKLHWNIFHIYMVV